MQRWTRTIFVCALCLVTLGATQPKARVVQARPQIPFAAAGRDGEAVPAAVRRLRVAYSVARSGRLATALVRRRPVAVKNASKMYKVVDLEAIVPGFMPTALNNDGRIVGISYAGDFGPSYRAHLINNSGSTGPLPPNEYCDGEDTDYTCFPTPTAITNKSGEAAGSFNEQIQYGEFDSGNYTGEIIWNLGATSAAVAFQDDGQDVRPIDASILSMANQNVPVGGRFYGDSTHRFPTRFSIDACPISNFSATSINDTGVIVGASNGRAASLELGGCPAYVPNVGLAESSADVVADDGDILIRYADSSAIWSKGRVVPIPLPAGYSASSYSVDALALNDNGVVVGVLNTKSGSGSPSASFEYANGRSVDLTSLFPVGSGWSGLTAVGINDSDEIIGQGLHAGSVQGFALRY